MGRERSGQNKGIKTGRRNLVYQKSNVFRFVNPFPYFPGFTVRDDRVSGHSPVWNTKRKPRFNLGLFSARLTALSGAHAETPQPV